MNMQVKRLLYKMCCLAMILSFCGCQDEAKTYESSGKVVKIGFIWPISGVNESWGKSSLLGVKTALLIQPLLLNGDRPEIVVADDMNDPDQAEIAVKKLVEDDGVSAILLASGSNAVLGVQELLEKYKIPSIALLATHPDVASGEYITQLPFDDTLQGTVAALYVMDEMIVDRATVFKDPSDVQSVFLAEIFANTFTGAGGDVEVIELPTETAALEKIIAGCRDKEEEFFYLPVHAAGVVEIEMISKKLGYDPKVLLSDGLLSRIILEFDSDLSLVEGMMAIDVYSNVFLTKGYGKKLVKAFDGSFTEPKTTFSALGAEGMSILLEAMDRCGDSQDRECVNRSIQSTNNFLGVNSKISINADGKTERPIFINTIVNNKLYFEVMVY